MTRKLVVLAVLILIGVGTLTAQRPEIVPDHYFVGFRAPIIPNDLANARARGMDVGNVFPEIRAIEVVVRNANQLSAFRNNPRVEYVEPVPMRYADSLDTQQLTPSSGNGLWGLVTTNAVNAHSNGYSAIGFPIGLADTGIDCNHPDIHDNLVMTVDKFSKRANGCWQSGDTNETHATHVAGTIVGVNNNAGIYGVAYNADLYHARVLGPNGGTVSQVMAGVQWLADQQVKVINLSLGGGRSSRTEENFYNKIRSKGILVVAASGNEGTTRVSYPAAYAANIAVGAVDRNDAIASFSNTGRNLDVVAPGVGILSSVPKDQGSEASVAAGSGNYTAFGMEFAAHTNGTTGTLVNCGLAISVTDCGGTAGFIALVQRGTNSFAEKTSNVMAAGAGAAIIYNNIPGDFQGTLGSATPSGGSAWIPVVSMSQSNGAALLPFVSTSATVLNLVSSWDTYDGTSMATPHVTGTIALMWKANPSLSNSQVESDLFSSCKDLGTPGYDKTYGYGRIDAAAAVTKANSPH